MTWTTPNSIVIGRKRGITSRKNASTAAHGFAASLMDGSAGRALRCKKTSTSSEGSVTPGGMVSGSKWNKKADSVKQKTCKVCKSPFTPRLPMACVCSPLCALSLARSARGKAEKIALVKERKADAVKRERLKSRSQWVKEAQTAVNRVARLRDIHAGHGCVSCGAAYQGRFGGAFDGGHYRSVGAAPHLRFYLPQISLQCVKCNRYLGGNATEARKGLIARHGVERVEAIEAMQGEGKWGIPYLQRLKKIMARMAGRLEKRIAVKGFV